MAELTFPVFSFMATKGYEDVEDGDMIQWNIGDEAWWIPSASYPTRDPIIVIIDSGRGGHNDAPLRPDGLHEAVYEVIFPDGRFSVCARQLRHKNFRPSATSV
jgi:hypothetical protein